jgi:hypothetical protein
VIDAPFRVFELDAGPRQLRVGPTSAEQTEPLASSRVT